MRRFEALGNIPGGFHLEILENGQFIADRRWQFTGVESPFNRLYVVLDGEAVIRARAGETHLRPGFAYLIPAGSENDYICTSRLEKLYFHFNLQAVAGKDVFENWNTLIEIPCPKCTRDMLLQLLEDGSLCAAARIMACVYAFAADFLTAAERDGFVLDYAPLLKYADILAYVRSNLYAGAQIGRIADVFQLSRHSLSKNFKRDTGIGLKEYAEKMIWLKAKQLLVTTDLTISEIAAKFCFCDPYYFSRFFKKYEGISPKHYRNGLKGKI